MPDPRDSSQSGRSSSATPQPSQAGRPSQGARASQADLAARRTGQIPAVPAPQGITRRQMFVYAAATIGAGILALSPPSSLLPGATDPERYDVVQGMRFEMWLIATEIGRFQQRSGRLPSSLAEISRSGRGVTYVRNDDGTYTLRSDDPPMTWQSTEPKSALLSRVPRTFGRAAAGTGQ